MTKREIVLEHPFLCPMEVLCLTAVYDHIIRTGISVGNVG